MIDYLTLKSFDNENDAKLSYWNGEGWYFWDETESICYGPYDTEELARDGEIKYCKEILNKK